MSKSKSGNTISVGFCGLLTIAFIVLKLTDQIDWSWWWVLSPIWGPVAIILGVVITIGLLTMLGFGVAFAIKRWWKKS